MMEAQSPFKTMVYDGLNETQRGIGLTPHQRATQNFPRLQSEGIRRMLIDLNQPLRWHFAIYLQWRPQST